MAGPGREDADSPKDGQRRVEVAIAGSEIARNLARRRYFPMSKKLAICAQTYAEENKIWGGGGETLTNRSGGGEGVYLSEREVHRHLVVPVNLNCHRLPAGLDPVPQRNEPGNLLGRADGPRQNWHRQHERRHSGGAAYYGPVIQRLMVMSKRLCPRHSGLSCFSELLPHRNPSTPGQLIE